MSHQVPGFPQPSGDPGQHGPPAVGMPVWQQPPLPHPPVTATPHRRRPVWLALAVGIPGLLLAVGSLFGGWVDLVGRRGAQPLSLWRFVEALGQQFGELSAAPAGYLLVTAVLLVAVVVAVVGRGRVQELARFGGAALAVVGVVNLVGAALDHAGAFSLEARPWPMRPGLTIWLGLAATVLLGLAAVLAPGRGPVAEPVAKPGAARWPWTFWVSAALLLVGVALHVASVPMEWRVRTITLAAATDTPETIVRIMQTRGYGGGISQMVIHLVTTTFLGTAVVVAHLLRGRARRLGRIVSAVFVAGALANLLAAALDVAGIATGSTALTYGVGVGFWAGLLAVVFIGAALLLAPGDLIGRFTGSVVPPQPSTVDATGAWQAPAPGPVVGNPAQPLWPDR